MIQSLWKGSMGKEDAKTLLNTLNEKELAIKKQLEKQFEEDSLPMLSRRQSDKLLHTIRDRAGIGIPTIKNKYPYKWLAAAAVLLLIGTIGILYQLQYVSSAEQEVLVTVGSSPINYNVRSGRDSMRHRMSDGSVVTLSPHTTIHYDSHYGLNNRAISLNGEGKFAVKRDTSLPFEVTANGFTTTALGTEFIVDGRQEDHTSVHLLSGKIVIHATAAAKMPIQDTYLLAGEVFHIDAKLRTALRSQAPSSPVSSAQKPAEQLTANNNRRINLRFDKEELTVVLQRIAAQFNTPIALDQEVPRTLTFTGEFAAADELMTILQTICLVNDLEQHWESEGNIIIRLKTAVLRNQADTIAIKSHPHN